MRKEFNDTGLCVAERHYMVETSSKIEKIVELIEKGKYFTINRPRQFGKTTILSLLFKALNQRDDYLAFKISFEGAGDAMFADERAFCPALLRRIAQPLMFTNPKLSEFFVAESKQIQSFEDLSQWISRYVMQTQKRVVLMIDEVDKSSDNQIFLHFLGMLREKYLQRNEGQDYSFQSVILAGVYDIKTLKLKIWPDSEPKYNSPWNIAVDFTVDLSFHPNEIVTMLQEYRQDTGVEMEAPAIAEKLFYYSSGYPYLVSKLCKFIDERILPSRQAQNWRVEDVDDAFKLIVNGAYSTTLFDSLTKNLEHHPELYAKVFDLVINGKSFPFNPQVPVIHLGQLYGILAPSEEGCKIHNRIFEQRIYDYMATKALLESSSEIAFSSPDYYTEDGLNLPVILQRFQRFMKEHYSHKDAEFLEREGRLLFLAFLKPIINGKGFEFKEPNVAEERRMDVVISYRRQRYVIELKRWAGPKAHQAGLQQLSDYLDIYSLQQGYLLIYDFSKHKEYKEEQIRFQDKEIFAVWV